MQLACHACTKLEKNKFIALIYKEIYFSKDAP